jgi:hypothetical protein
VIRRALPRNRRGLEKPVWPCVSILTVFIPAKRLVPLVFGGRTAMPTECGAQHPLGGCD